MVQLYLSFPDAAGEPPQQLKGFDKAFLEAGASATVGTIDLLMTAYRVLDLSHSLAPQSEWNTMQSAILTVSLLGSRMIRVAGR